MFLQNIENPVKVRNQLKRMFKQNAQYCYTWDFETRQVCGLDKSEYVASLYEVQINGLVKRCECWVKQRFIIQRQNQPQADRRNNSFESRSEKSSKSPNKSALNSQQNHNTNSLGNNNSSNVSLSNHLNQNGYTQINSPLVPQHDKYVIRFESYGHSKRDRMTQSINPLSYAFDKILVDYVYLFIETEEVSKQKLVKEINKAIQNARYYDAMRKVTQLEEVFNERNTPLTQGFLNTINQKKKEQEQLNQILVSNLQVSTPKNLSQSPSSSGRVLRSSDSQKKLNQLQPSQPNQQTSQKPNQKETQQNDHNKVNGKQQKEKGNAQNLNNQSSGQIEQNASSSSPQINNSSLLSPQSYLPPSNSIASQTRNRSPMINSSTPSVSQSPNKTFSLNGPCNSSNNTNNNSPQKPHVTHGSPKKVAAFNSSPSKSTIAANCSDNNQSPKQTILSVITTRSSTLSPKKVGNQSPQKIIQSSPRITPSPSPKSTNVSKQQSQNQQQQQQVQHNFKTPSNEISTRSQTTQLTSSTQQDINNKSKKKTSNENEKSIPQSPIPSSLTMQTRYQEQIQLGSQSPLIQKTSAKSSDLLSNEKVNQNSNKTEMEIEESNQKQQSKEKQSPKRKALK